MKKEDLKKEILRIVDKNAPDLDLYVFLFGSRATGEHQRQSDYDIGLLAATEIPLSILSKIKSHIEDLPTIEEIDVVDFNQVSTEFKKLALEKVEIWKTPKKKFPLS